MLKWLSIDNLIKLAGLISVLVSVCLGIWTNVLKDENKRLENNLYQKTVEYTDSEGRLVKEVMELRVSKQELININRKKEADLSDYERKLKQISDEVLKSKIRVKNIESAGIISTENTASGVILMIDTVIQEMPIKRAALKTNFENIELVYNPITDSISYSFQTRNDIIFLINRKCKLKESGKRHFPQWGRIWGWDYWMTVKNTNDSTKIIDEILIKVNTFKRN